MPIDPMSIPLPGSDEGLRSVLRRMQGLETRVAELAATLGSQGALYQDNVFHVSGPAIFDGTLEIAGGLIGASALDSQITATSDSQTNASWQPGASWAAAATATLARPSWATSVIIMAGGYINPKWNLNSGSPYAYGRIVAAGQTSPTFISLMASVEVPAGLTWPIYVTSPAETIPVTVQAYAASGTTLAGGSASASAVALWLR